ncbi:NUMOD4 motif protein [compost metagenome]|nr:NUMOD4 motif-containing HNH endonuclease [Serratia liquefaciens]
MEEWKQTQYENYEVSSYGNVRNTKTGKVLKQRKNKNGYNRINVSQDGKKKTVEVHRLVAETFLVHQQKIGLVVNHINTDRIDNRASNLEWTTVGENNRKRNKPKVFIRKLTKDEYTQIAEKYTTGLYNQETLTHWVCSTFEIKTNHHNIYNLVNGKTYSKYFERLPQSTRESMAKVTKSNRTK